MTTSLLRSTPGFKESDTDDSPLGRFAKAEFFADWQAVKKRIGEKRKSMGTLKHGAFHEPKKAKGEEACLTFVFCSRCSLNYY